MEELLNFCNLNFYCISIFPPSWINSYQGIIRITFMFNKDKHFLISYFYFFQNSLIHFLSFDIEEPTIFIEISYGGFYMSKKHLFAFV